MANANVYSGKEFNIYVNTDKTGANLGTFNDATGDTWKSIDLDSFAFPNFNPIQEFEMRTGTGRVATHGSMFTSDAGVTREVSISGRLTDDILQIFGENVIGKKVASGEIIVEHNHSPSTLAHGGTIVTGEYDKTLSLYFASPIPAESIKMSGCVVTSFEVTADMGTASGRFNFSATLQTGYKPTKGLGGAGADTAITPTAISSTYFFLSDLIQKALTPSGESAIDPLMTTFSFAINGSAQFLGQQGANGDPEVIGRQLPELELTYNLGIKYDDDTALLVDKYRDTDQNFAFYLSDVAESGGGFGSGSAKIGFDVNNSVITSLDFDSGDIAMLNVGFKVTAPVTGEPFGLQVS